MIVLSQFSYTSVKKALMASSVAGDSGFAAMDVLARLAFVGEGRVGEWRRRSFMSRGISVLVGGWRLGMRRREEGGGFGRGKGEGGW